MHDSSAPFAMGETGRKNDATKARWDLLPWDALAGMVEVLTYGARKYTCEVRDPETGEHRTVSGARNWEKGLSQQRLVAALMRHLVALARGELHDPESGLPHVDHLLCCAAILAALWRRGLGDDFAGHVPPSRPDRAAGASARE